MQKFTLRIQVEIVQGEGYGSGLRISEATEFKADTFSELCEILTRFHDLSNELQKHKA